MDPIVLLLTSRSAVLRSLVLETLVEDADEAELASVRGMATGDPLVRDLLELQTPGGGWNEPPTDWALFRLGALGFGVNDPGTPHAVREAIGRGAEQIFSRQRADGSFPIPAGAADDGAGRHGYDMVPLQTALPLVGLASCGYAEDPRSARAYEWLLEQRLDDGAWPTGRAGGVYGYVAGYRRLPHSRWGCRSNTTAAALALACAPRGHERAAARRAVDLLLVRETREAAVLGFETARLMGYEPVRGFFTRFARFDPGLILELAAATGFGRSDARVAELADWVAEQAGASGLWRYESNPNASLWVSYRLLTTLRALRPESETPSTEMRTPFRAYPAPRHRS